MLRAAMVAILLTAGGCGDEEQARQVAAARPEPELPAPRGAAGPPPTPAYVQAFEAGTWAASDATRAMDFAVGQWARYQSNPTDGVETTLTWRVVGEHEHDWLVEIESVSDVGWTVTKLAVHVGGRNDAAEIQIAAAQMQGADGAVRDLHGQMLDASRRLYGPFTQAAALDWGDAPTEDVEVAAGRFVGAHRREHTTRFGPFREGGTMWHHGAVPILGIVEMRGEEARVELVGFGTEGATGSIRAAFGTPAPERGGGHAH